MRHFIPDSKDLLYYERFLHEHRIEAASDDVRWWETPPAHGTGSAAESTTSISTTTNGEKLPSDDGNGKEVKIF